LERIYSGIRYLGRKREFEEHTGGNQKIQKGISAGHGRYGIARVRRRNIPMGRIAGKIHSKETIWVVR